MEILLADDHPLYREGLRSILSELAMPTEFREVNDVEQLRQFLEESGRFDLVVLGNLSGLDSYESLLLINDLNPGKVLLIASEGESNRNRHDLAHLGVAATIPRVISSELLKNIVQLILAGGVWSPEESPFQSQPRTSFPLHSPEESPASNGGIDSSYHSAQQLHPRIQLTTRQQEVLERMADGMKNREIARQLDISEFTVKLHVTSLLRIFRVDNRIQAINRAREMGFLSH